MGIQEKSVAVIVGTRPEAIKMAPVIASLRRRRANVKVISTGQHDTLMAPVLELFGIVPDANLAVMRRCRSVSDVFGTLVSELPPILAAQSPDLVLVHGDTATAAAASVTCYLNRFSIGHVEAGLRSFDLSQPWPEEFNRRLIDIVSSIYFAPTVKARDALLAEGVTAHRIFVTGNTVVDALLAVAESITQDGELRSRLERRFGSVLTGNRIVLVTSHRRENFGQGLKNICDALRRLASDPSVTIVWPLHLNPQVRAEVYANLGSHRNIHIVDPAGYLDFTYLMMRCSVILTDSGGVQEEAPSLGKPLVILRSVTERPEVIDFGLATLVGTDPDQIVAQALVRLNQKAINTTRHFNPFGDGHAAERIAGAVEHYLTGTQSYPLMAPFQYAAGRESSPTVLSQAPLVRYLQ
jgi:UDP-N-acetylglucosamine 2-epimerase (non-hydrolysing)